MSGNKIHVDYSGVSTLRIPSRVIFKANFLSLFFVYPQIYRYLEQASPGVIPVMISHKIGEAGVWVLFEAVQGEPVDSLGRSDLLLEMARTLARVQSDFSVGSKVQVSEFPQFGTEQKAEMLGEMIGRIRDDYVPIWEKAGGATLKRGKTKRLVEIPEKFDSRLEASPGRTNSHRGDGQTLCITPTFIPAMPSATATITSGSSIGMRRESAFQWIPSTGWTPLRLATNGRWEGGRGP